MDTELVCFPSGIINDSGRTIASYKALNRRPFIAKATVLYSDYVFKNYFTLPGIDLRYFSDPGRNLGIVLNNTGQQNLTFFVPRTSIDERSSTFYAEFRYAYRIFLSGMVSKVQQN